MADVPLFDLTADGKFRLAYDSRQWVLQQRKRKPRARQFDGRAVQISGYEGVWFVGRNKRVMGEAVYGLDLTPEARQRFDALPDTFDEFYAGICGTTIGSLDSTEPALVGGPASIPSFQVKYPTGVEDRPDPPLTRTPATMLHRRLGCTRLGPGEDTSALTAIPDRFHRRSTSRPPDSKAA